MSEIRKYFESRFTNGYLMEFDFSQLEVVVLAYLSQDKQLIQDIVDGIDIHRVNAAKMYDVPTHYVTEKQRKVAKGCTFQLQYGAGAASMAKTWGISTTLARKFIDAYYTRYPDVKKWQDKNIHTVQLTRWIHKEKKTKAGYPQSYGHLFLPTGRKLVFKEYDIKPMWGGRAKPLTPTGFSPTEIKNYPVQSLATGDIVPMILGKLYRVLKSKSKETQTHVKMINTVHDSIVFDVAKNYRSRVYDMVMEVMLNTPTYLKKDFGIDFNVPINADCKCGKNWLEMVDYSPELGSDK